MGSAELVLGAGMLLAAIAAYLLASSLLTNNTDKDTLSWASGNEPAKSKSPIINSTRPLVHNFTLQHALRIKSPKQRKNIEQLLLTAGLSRELNVDEFLGLQLLMGILLPAFLTMMNFTLDMGIPLIVLIFLFPLGYQWPKIYARAEKQRREVKVRKDLPFFADLLALSTEAGLDFIGAIQRIVDKASEDSVLAEELAIVLKDIKLGASRADALRGLGKRVDSQEITSFVAVLIDADSTGASIAQVLKDQSTQIRLERFVRAEKAGARASQAMLGPIVLFIIPAVFLVVMGPIVVSFFTGKGR